MAVALYCVLGGRFIGATATGNGTARDAPEPRGMSAGCNNSGVPRRGRWAAGSSAQADACYRQSGPESGGDLILVG